MGEELENIGVKVLHYIAYNIQSMGMVERSVRTLNENLKEKNSLSLNLFSIGKALCVAIMASSILVFYL